MKILILLLTLSFSHFASAAYLENTCNDSNDEYRMIHSSTTDDVSFEMKELNRQGADLKSVFKLKLDYSEFLKLVKALVNEGSKEIELENSEFKSFVMIKNEKSYSFRVDGIKFDNCFKS